MFKPAFIDARDLNEAYYSLLKQCYKHGYEYKITDGSFKGATRLELPFATGFIHFPHTRPLAPIMPEGVSPTTTDEKIEVYFQEYLMNPYKNKKEEYKYSTWVQGKFYNKYLQKFDNQLDWCINHFKEKGFGNNHCFITIGGPKINYNYDAIYTNETERKTSPCLRGLDIKIKDNKVLLGIIYRSWDLYAGFPENMGGFALLNQYIASELDIEPGPLSFTSQGLHCYDFQLKSVLGYLQV